MNIDSRESKPKIISNLIQYITYILEKLICTTFISNVHHLVYVARVKFLMTDNIQKNSHSELSQEEQALRYRALVDSMNDGFGIIDNGGVLTYVNERFATMLGYKQETMVGKQIIDFIDSTNRKILRENIRRRSEGQSTQYELEWTKKNGEQVPTIASG
ncbi:MAG: PAS domain S-box protein, partial [Candidatus Thorarchaeota archaeon]